MMMLAGDLAICFIAIIFGGYLPLFLSHKLCAKPVEVRVKENRGRRRPF